MFSTPGTGAIVRELDLWALLRKRARLIGSTLRARTPAFKAALIRKFAADYAGELQRGDLRPVVDKVPSCFIERQGPVMHGASDRKCQDSCCIVKAARTRQAATQCLWCRQPVLLLRSCRCDCPCRKGRLQAGAS